MPATATIPVQSPPMRPPGPISVPIGCARPAYISTSAVTSLADLWLHLHLGSSRRSLAALVRAHLVIRGVGLSLDTVQRVLGGHQPLARRETRDALMDLLIERGLRTPAQIHAMLAREHERIERSVASRTFATPERFHALVWAFKVETRQPSSRKLATTLQARLASRGARVGLHRLQELVDGPPAKVRLVFVEELETLVKAALPPGRTLEDAIKESRRSPETREDLGWIPAAPVARLARQWLSCHPRGSLRQLAQRVAETAKTLGYQTTHHTIQPVLSGHKHRTRGFVYRALRVQLPQVLSSSRPAAPIQPSRHPLAPEPAVKTEAPPVEAPRPPRITLAPGTLLDRATERELATRWRRQGDRDAANVLVEANLRYVAKLAGSYRGYGVEVADLIAEGTLGLFEALRYFDPERNLRFLTYAGHWVRKCMLEYLLKNSGVVSLRRGQPEARMFFALRREQAAIEAQEAQAGAVHAPTVPTVHEELAVRFATTETRVREFSQRLSRGDLSLDAPSHVSDERRPMDRLRDAGQTPEELAARAERAAFVRQACATLDPRERVVVEARLLTDPDDRESLEQVGVRLGLSRERVRQIELRAGRKLRMTLAPLIAPTSQALRAS